MQARKGNPWLWRRVDSDSGISSSEGSGSILRRGEERTKYRDEETLLRRRENYEEHLLRGRRSNSLHRRPEGVPEREFDGSLLRNVSAGGSRVREGSLLRREKEREKEADWNWFGSRWEGRRARSQSDAMATRRESHGQQSSSSISSQLWRRRSASRGETRAQSQPRSGYFYKKQIETAHNGDTENWSRREGQNLRYSRRLEEAWELKGGEFSQMEQEEERRVSRRSIIHRSLSRSKTGGKQDERSVEERMKPKRQLGHTLSDMWTGESDVQYGSLSRDIICGSLLRGKRQPPVSHKSMERGQAEHHKATISAILEDAQNMTRGQATMEAKPRVSLRRLSRMTSHHHLPRLPSRPLAGSLRSSSCSSLSQASSASRPMPILLTSSSASSLTDTEEGISLAHIDQNLIVHSYVASRGQREKEVEIYEHLPAYRLIKARNSLRLGSVSVC